MRCWRRIGAPSAPPLHAPLRAPLRGGGPRRLAPTQGPHWSESRGSSSRRRFAAPDWRSPEEGAELGQARRNSADGSRKPCGLTAAYSHKNCFIAETCCFYGLYIRISGQSCSFGEAQEIIVVWTSDLDKLRLTRHILALSLRNVQDHNSCSPVVSVSDSGGVIGERGRTHLDSCRHA